MLMRMNLLKKIFSEDIAIHVLSCCGIWILFSFLMYEKQLTIMDIIVTLVTIIYTTGYYITKYLPND